MSDRISLSDLAGRTLDPQQVHRLQTYLAKHMPVISGAGADRYVRIADIERRWGSMASFNAELVRELGIFRDDATGAFETLVTRTIPDFTLTRSQVCDACLRENQIPPEDSDYHYCTYCGVSLKRGLKFVDSHFQSYPEMLILFLKLSDYNSGDAEDLVQTFEQINYFLQQAIRSLGGQIKTMGDKYLVMLANFGSSPHPLTLEQHVFKSLAFLSLLAGYLQWWNKEHGGSITFRVGIHAGNVLGGIMGVTGLKRFDIIGREVNYAARVLGHSQAGSSVVISERVAQLLRAADYEQLELLGAWPLKGFSADGPQSLYGLNHLKVLPFNDAQHHRFVFDDSQATRTCANHSGNDGEFCPHCGNRVEEETSTLSAEYRDVYVLSIDIINFSDRASQMEPSQVLQWINDFHQIAEPIVARHHGTIAQRNGDELVIRFGYPSVGHNEINATLAAYELELAFEAWNTNPASFPIHFRIGIAHRRALVRGDTLWGDVIEWAQDLQSRAPRDGILVDDATRQQIAPYFEIDNHADAYRISAPRTQAIDMAMKLREQLPPIGREEQIRRLEDALAAARSDGLQTRILLGPTGSARQSAITQFISGHANEVGYLSGTLSRWMSNPLKAVLRERYELALSLDPERGQAHFLAPLAGLTIEDPNVPDRATMEALIPVILGRYIGAPIRRGAIDLEVAQWDPKRVQYWVREILTYYLQTLAEESPIAIFVQNFELADRESLELLKGVFTRIASHPILFATSATIALADSGEIQESLQGFPNHEIISFPQLSLDQAARFIHHLLIRNLVGNEVDPSLTLEGSPLPPRLISDLYDLTDGHPLYLAELIRTYQERGWIRPHHEDVGWIYEPTSDNHIPHTLDEALLARVDKLPAEDRLLFRVCAICADQRGLFWSGILSELVEEFGYDSETDLSAALARLEQRGFISKQQVGTIREFTEYRITPPVLGEVVYNSITMIERRRLHMFIQEWLAEQVLPRTEQRHDMLALTAYHATRAELNHRAHRFYQQAIALAERPDAIDNAAILSYVNDAIALLESEKGKDHSAKLFDLLRSKVRVYAREVQVTEWREAIERLMELGEHTGNPEHQLIAINHFIDLMVTTNDYDPAWIVGTEQKIATDYRRFTANQLAQFYYCIGKLYSGMNQYTQALSAYENARHYAAINQDPKQQGNALLGMATVEVRRLNYREAIAKALGATRLFESVDDAQSICYSWITIGSCYLDLGQYDDAHQAFTRALDSGRRADDKIGIGYAIINFGNLEAFRGNFAAAINRVDEVIAMFAKRSIPSLSMVAYFLKSMLISREEPAEGLRLAEAALLIQGYPAYRASAHLAQAISHYRGGSLDRAIKSIGNALSIRQGLENQKLELYERELLDFIRILKSRLAREPQGIPEFLNTADMPTSQAASPISPLIRDLIPGADVDQVAAPVYRTPPAGEARATARVRSGAQSVRPRGRAGKETQAVPAYEPPDPSETKPKAQLIPHGGNSGARGAGSAAPALQMVSSPEPTPLTIVDGDLVEFPESKLIDYLRAQRAEALISRLEGGKMSVEEQQELAGMMARGEPVTPAVQRRLIQGGIIGRARLVRGIPHRSLIIR